MVRPLNGAVVLRGVRGLEGGIAVVDGLASALCGIVAISV